MSKRRLRGFLGLLVSVALLWWVLHDVSIARVWREIRRADPILMTASVAVGTAGYAIRAVRWRLLLIPERRDVPYRPRFAAVCIGTMVNNCLPARLGEFARALGLSNLTRVPIGASFASVVVERVLDGIVLALLLLLTLLLPGTVDGGIPPRSVVVNVAEAAAVAFSAALLILWLIARFPDWTLSFVTSMAERRLPGGLAERVGDAAAAFVRGLRSLRAPGLFVGAVVWTFLLWLWLAASVWLGLQAFGIRAPGLSGSILIQSVIAFAVALPSSPGFFGPFEAAARLSLGLYGVPVPSVVAFATGYHILMFLPVTAMGFWYLRGLDLDWSQLGRSEAVVRSGLEKTRGSQASGDPPAEPNR